MKYPSFLIILPLLLGGLLSPTVVKSQNAFQRAAHGINYGVEASVVGGKGKTPLWLTSNRYGLSSVNKSNGYLRVGISRDVNLDSLSHFRLGYGADVALAYDFTSTFIVQQLYADMDYKRVRLTVGAKEYPMEFKNQELSSGSQTFGKNARPIPQIRFGLPEYWNITGRGNWAAIKGFIAYGMQTDGRFQKDYLPAYSNYCDHVIYHAKAGYLKVGNEDKFPLVFEGGLEMATQFGGNVHRYKYDEKTGTYEHYKIATGHSFRDFIDATLGIGGDSTDDIYANATGNTVGSWLLRLSYKGSGWGASVYYDHFFEDHSQMFFEYGWKDGLIGVEVNLPRNPVVSSVVFERLDTRDQSGAVYHDHTDAIPDQISARDQYYYHAMYNGWEHWGYVNGNPFYISPLYNSPRSLYPRSNRFTAHHLGISGNPLPALSYRIMYTHERSLGTYLSPYFPAKTSDSFLVEARYAPQNIGSLNTQGWEIGLALGMDRGDLLGDNTAFNVTVSKRGLLIR